MSRWMSDSRFRLILKNRTNTRGLEFVCSPRIGADLFISSLVVLLENARMYFVFGWTYPSPKISQAKALVKFSRYKAAQEAARGKIGLNWKETGCRLLSRVCLRCTLRTSPWSDNGE
jgi:hypothetical protein